MNRYFLGAFAIVFLLYGAVEAWPLIAGPSLNIESPADFATVEGGVVEIIGVAKRSASLTLDGTPLLPDQNGSFEKTLAFAKGASILTFVATDRFGRTVTDARTIFVP